MTTIHPGAEPVPAQGRPTTPPPASGAGQSSPPWHGLQSRLTGELALPGTPTYETRSATWNVALPVSPAAVVAAADALDVAHAVRFATAHGLRVGVQCTGHGPTSTMEGALLVSTAGLSECVVHPEGWARVGAGVKWKAVVEAAAPHGLAPLNGSSSDVGVVGYTTGGGLGPFARSLGLASDRVRAFEVVTADGRLRRVTATQEPDLYWGLRGGKGALGIVTAVEFDLVPLSSFYGGAVYFDGADAHRVLHAWRTWAATLPESATTSVALLQLPPMPGVPEVLAGRLTAAVRFTHVGDHAEGEALLAPLRAVAEPLLDGVGVLPYAAVDAVHADPVDPMPALERSSLLSSLDAAAVDALLAAAGGRSGSSLVIVELRQIGGAVARGGAVDSAVCWRDTAFLVLTIGIAVPPLLEVMTASAERVHSALAPWVTGRAFPNFASDGAAYDAPTLARLRALVHAHDPAGVLLAADILDSGDLS